MHIYKVLKIHKNKLANIIYWHELVSNSKRQRKGYHRASI